MEKTAGEQILMFLKMRTEATSLEVAQKLDITKEGARKHLISLANKGLIEPVLKNIGVGRPSTYYILTSNGLSKFPDTHADITVQLLRSVKNLLGENALDLLINDREKVAYDRYQTAMENRLTLEERLETLVKLRSDEGYMAEWNTIDEAYYLTENHCPICAAARECQGFCRSELKNFQTIIGEEYKIERIEHLLSDGNRCKYKITAI
ncbi:metalloregulator ArsR/SmtB family transcription factor [Chryseobacterium sp. CFBP8996]|uniref:helix-turn-helix transcriptional regulator n=1 Tax=Chryseobacterium sp. CFBP8996 TaxID=3096529 RepID=UPI002A6A7F0B|nr:metalloregulator ArsR/SmtB family transcription factor [Chryseobacterium sp. CFBP8996]MDY0933173.1 metalloregulator ArsR/SmtB family transcription factor [Chryseobacterium sp. CFBP8996]